MPAQDAKLNYGPMHVNSNVLCAIDVRHDGRNMLEVCFIPMNHSYEKHKKMQPLHMRMRPSFPVDHKLARLSEKEIKDSFVSAALDMVDGRSQFERWCEQIVKLKKHKKLLPVVWDWSHIRTGLADWLESSFEELIHESVRDLNSIANFMKDRYDAWGEDSNIKFDTFSSLLLALEVEAFDKNSLTANAKAIQEAYYRLMRFYVPGYYQKDKVSVS